MSDRADRFAALAQRLGATRDAHPAARSLLAAYSHPARAYHGVAHLEDCLARLDETSAPGQVRDLVEAAVWFHDAVYDPRSDDNEHRSAALARQVLADLGVPGSVVAEVARLVLLTDHQSRAVDDAGRLLSDIDLSILGRSAETFDAYDAAIRTEYAWVPDETYRARRRAILRRLLEREPLYLTETFRLRYEAAARHNLRRALERLGE